MTVIDLVVGARPNFVKAAAILNAAKKYPNVQINLVHTGQHKDIMSDPYFVDLELPDPIRHVAEGSVDCSRHARLGNMTTYLSHAFGVDKPDYVMVVGDTDSTLAGAIAAAKSGITLAHVEAGLRNGDMTMQEELNRRMVDSVSDICYTTTAAARDTLIAEGHDPRDVHFVGNVMIDTLIRFLPKAKTLFRFLSKVKDRPYAILTLHRAETVDDDCVIFPLLDAIREIANDTEVIWPIHPRLRSRIGAWSNNGKFTFERPLSYLNFIALLSEAKFVMTDSGGVQEESTALGIPCCTLRDNTERPETVEDGTNCVLGTSPYLLKDRITDWVQECEERTWRHCPELWDGYAADRLMANLVGGEK